MSRTTSRPKPQVKIIKWKNLRLRLPRLLEHAALDWKRLIVAQESGSLLRYEYPVSAKFFLNCAREDFEEKTPRGLINALSNAKRAIDCQTDSHICAIGFTPQKLQKQIGKAGIVGVAQFSKNQNRPITFRVLESLSVVTPGIVDRVRKIRHLLEHEYKKPTRSQVRDAIDIASLYVSALEGSMNSFLENVHLRFGEMRSETIDDHTVPERSVSFQLYNWHELVVVVWFRDFVKHESAEVRILPKDQIYLDVIRLFYAARARENFEKALSVVASSSGIQLPVKSIGIAEWRFD
jgi:hypothetical protein